MLFKNLVLSCALVESSLSIGRVKMVFKNLCIHALRAKVTLALKGVGTSVHLFEGLFIFIVYFFAELQLHP